MNTTPDQSDPRRVASDAADTQEQALLRAIRAGETGAWGLLTTRYQDRVYAVCLRMVGDRDAAADLTQDTFVKVIQGLTSYDGRSKLSTWIIRVAMNACLSWKRSQKLRRHASLDAPGTGDNDDDGHRGAWAAGSGGVGGVGGEPGPAQSVELREQNDRVAAGLAALGPEQRAILVLRDVQGLDYEQIAEVLGVAVGTVKSRLFRARLALREAIEGRVGGRGDWEIWGRGERTMSGPSGHIPEHELLELVEGTLSPDREAVVRAAVAREPRLGQLVARMRADRRSLQALGQVRAPTGLTERVEAVLEREALLSLNGDGLAGHDSIPISTLRPRRASIVTRAWRHPAARGLSMAAGLALVIGGGIWAISVLSPRLPDLTRPPLAVNPDVSEPEPELAPTLATNDAPAPAELVGPPAPDQLAIAAADPDDHAQPEPPAVAAALDEPMTAARALELARRGRLAVIVRSRDAETAAINVEGLARASGRAGVWQRIDSGAAGGRLAAGFETVAALWSPNAAPPVPFPHVPGREDPAVAANDRTPPTPLAAQSPLPGAAWSARTAPPRAVWTVSVEDRESTLVSLLAALGRESAGERAEFIELPTAIDAPPPADPDAVLWWEQPAGAWWWRVNVPVIVEETAR